MLRTSAYGFDLPDHVTALRATIARFVREEIVPAERALAPDARAIPPDHLQRLQEKARAWACGASMPARSSAAPSLSTFSSSTPSREPGGTFFFLYIYYWFSLRILPRPEIAAARFLRTSPAFPAK